MPPEHPTQQRLLTRGHFTHAACALIAAFTISFGGANLAHCKSPGRSSNAVSPRSTPSATTPRDSHSKRQPIANIEYEKYRLENGLEIILHTDHSLPLAALSIWYHVGPVNEPPKRSGFAHLFEHLMFSGSRHVGSNFDEYLEAVGATNVNGTTNWDRTNYFETVPREHLELALWLESDRMGFLMDEFDPNALEIQRDVVKNERRQSFENAPYGPSNLKLMDTLFPEGHPYHGAVIGSMADLSAASLDDVRNFYNRYYAPSNATLAIAGDIDITATKALINKYFGGLRKLPRPPTEPHAFSLPNPARLVVEEPVKLVRVAFGWVTPPAYSASSAAAEIAAEVLGGGKASRLYRSLVVTQKLAADIDVDADANALGTLFTVEAFASSGISTETLEAALNTEITKLAVDKPSSTELERARNRIFLQAATDLQALNGHGGESGRLGQLQRFNHYLGNPGAAENWYSQLGNVSAEDVSIFAKAWLTSAHRITVITSSKG